MACRDVVGQGRGRDVAWRDVACRAVAGRDVAGRDVAWRDVACRDVVGRDVAGQGRGGAGTWRGRDCEAEKWRADLSGCGHCSTLSLRAEGGGGSYQGSSQESTP